MSSSPPKKTFKQTYGHLLTGGVAGAISRTATSPLERLRILQQTSNPEYAGRSTLGSFIHMQKLEGFRGFFKGNGMTMVKIIPFSAAEFFFYDFFKTNLYPNTEAHALSNW
jgi:solute carrier family 25 (mitochondrial phosphate transporter), member 23/24/25/41